MYEKNSEILFSEHVYENGKFYHKDGQTDGQSADNSVISW